MILLWPVIVLCSVTGFESFEIPTAEIFGYLLLNAVLGTALSDFLWLKSILLISAVVATVGLSLTIPIAMFSDMLIYAAHYEPLYIVGAILVSIGFMIVNFDFEVLVKLLEKRKEWNRNKTQQ